MGIGQKLVQAGQEADHIFLVVDGELDVYITNNGQETVLDTIYSGCTIGTYSILNSDLHTISVRARYDSNVMALDFESLTEVRDKYSELDHYMTEYEDYIATYGLPYCDYKLYRHSKTRKIPPMEKFRVGMHRILKIIKSSKSQVHINDMLKKVQDQIRLEERKKREKGQRGKKKKEPLEMIPMLMEHIENLTAKVNTMQKTIDNMS